MATEPAQRHCQRKRCAFATTKPASGSRTCAIQVLQGGAYIRGARPSDAGCEPAFKGNGGIVVHMAARYLFNISMGVTHSGGYHPAISPIPLVSLMNRKYFPSVFFFLIISTHIFLTQSLTVSSQLIVFL